MELRISIAGLFLTLLLTGCTYEEANINLNNLNNDVQQMNQTDQCVANEHDVDDVMDLVKPFEDLTYLVNELPSEIISLSFTSLLFEEVEQIEAQNNSLSLDDWIFVKSIPFSYINQQAATLQLYSINDNNGTDQRVDGILNVADTSYHFSDLSPEIMTDNLSCNVLCVYQKFFSAQQQYELIGVISLAANSPGLKKYVVYDSLNDGVLSFDAWGSPHFIDLNNDNIEEFVIQFEGVHQSPPDVSITDYIDNELKISSSVFEHIEKQEGDYALLQLDKLNEPNIYISNRIEDENQLFGYNYSYDKGQLILIKQ